MSCYFSSNSSFFIRIKRGFTLALSTPDAKILVAELVSQMISWNIHHLGDLAGNPLEDPRVSTQVADVADFKND